MTDPTDVAVYVGGLAKELADLSARAGLENLTYIFKMAELEAGNAASTRCSKQRDGAIKSSEFDAA